MERRGAESLPTGSCPLPCLSHPYSDWPPSVQHRRCGNPGCKTRAAAPGMLSFLSPSLSTRESHCLGANVPACSCTHTSLCPGGEVHSLLCGLRRAWGVCLGAQSQSCLHRVCGLWWFRVCTGAWGQAASDAGSGVAPTAPGQCWEEGIQQGPRPPRGLAPPTHLSPPRGVAGETPVGPGKRISKYSLTRGWGFHSWEREHGHGWSTDTVGAI